MNSALVPFNELQRMAEAAAKSKMFGVQNVEQAITIMLIAQAEGRHPMAAAKDYDVINGKPSKKAEAMLRDFLASNGKVEWHKYADDGCDATFSHPQGGTVRVSWDKARMVQAKITNEAMYSKYPRAMYRARCVSEGVRTVCPSATGGLYVPDEVRAITAEKDMGRAEQVVAKVAPEQIEAIHTALSENGVELSALLAHGELGDISEIAAEDAPKVIRWIQKQKKA